MGKFRKRNRGSHKNQGTKQVDGERGDYKTGGSYKDILRENPNLNRYYKEQNIVPESEWEDFCEALKRDLPSTFRIAGTQSHAKDLLRALKRNHIAELEESTDSEEQSSLAPLKWYPEELAWETKVAKRVIRKSEKLKKFHNFLVQENNCGAVTRQEAVSMIPPLFMNIKPHYKVLDMCAAPGSKTAQLIEMMNEGSENELPSGCVIANDADNKRCYMLVHQSRRLHSSCCMVTNHDASIFPFLITVNESTGYKEPVFFDRILCDVPCSGDGTVRKNPQIWTRWSPQMGVPLHKLQMRILVRGLELLAEGGQLVYSTCSMNPLENEAVVAMAIQMSKGAVELVDVSDQIPELKRSPGLSTWKVFNKAGVEYKTYEDVLKETIDGQYKKSMFPPTEEEAKSLNLERCIRVYPHQQDTGGFFIAVLQKKAVMPWQSTGKAWRMAHRKLLPWEYLQKKEAQQQKAEQVEADGKSADPVNSTSIDPVAEDEMKIENNIVPAEQVSENDKLFANQSEEVKEKGVEEPPKKKRKRLGFYEDPFVFVDDDNQTMKDILDFYGFSNSFPKKQIVIRTNDGIKRNIYFVSKSVKQILDYNVDNLKIINSGVKIFTRCSLKTGVPQNCQFRLTQEGINTTYRFIEKQKVNITYDDLVLLITEGEPHIAKLSEETKQQFNDMNLGCVVWNYKSPPESSEILLSSDIWMCGYRGKSTVRCMMPKADRMHFLRILDIPTDSIKDSDAMKETDTMTISVEQQDDIAENDDDKIVEDCTISPEDSDRENKSTDT